VQLIPGLTDYNKSLSHVVDVVSGAPAVRLASNATDAVKSIFDQDKSKEEVSRKVARMIPYQNLFYLRALFEMIFSEENKQFVRPTPKSEKKKQLRFTSPFDG
jgi:hypothetical protein